MFLEHINRPGMAIFFFFVTFISIKIVHDSLLYPLDTKLLEGCTFVLERSDVTTMNSVFLNWVIELQLDEKALWYEY